MSREIVKWSIVAVGSTDGPWPNQGLEKIWIDVVGQAGDGESAVRLAQEHRPDLVILDVKMPVLDGIAAAEAIAGQRIAPVIVLTAFSQRVVGPSERRLDGFLLLLLLMDCPVFSSMAFVTSFSSCANMFFMKPILIVVVVC